MNDVLDKAKSIEDTHAKMKSLNIYILNKIKELGVGDLISCNLSLTLDTGDTEKENGPRIIVNDEYSIPTSVAANRLSITDSLVRSLADSGIIDCVRDNNIQHHRRFSVKGLEDFKERMDTMSIREWDDIKKRKMT